MNRILLLIGPQFFGYRDELAGEFVRQGWSVDAVCDRPSSSVLFKSACKIDYRLVDGPVARYAAGLERRVAENGYGAVLFLGGMTFPFKRSQLLGIMRAARCPVAAYLWDSVANCKRMGTCLDLFDAVMSFEEGAHPGSICLPLFFTGEYEGAASVPLEEAEFDACFVGSVHQPSKFEAIVSTVDILRAAGLTVETRYYMPSRSSLALRRIQNPVYRRSDISFTHDPIDRRELSALYARCTCVIDAPQAGQSGLTMRTIEALGAGRRLVTANAAVRGYDFFRYGDVLVAGESSPEGLVSFCKGRTRSIPDDVRKRYSLRSWVATASKNLEDLCV